MWYSSVGGEQIRQSLEGAESLRGRIEHQPHTVTSLHGGSLLKSNWVDH